MSQVTVERIDRVAVLELNDPDHRNALNLEMNAQLVDTIDELEADAGVGALVITGSGTAFCAGADLSELGTSGREGLQVIYEGFLRVARTRLATIAAVNGAAVGAGMNLALACDVRVAAHSARFDTRFVQIGIHPGGGHTWMMLRATDLQTTMATTVFGEVLDGPEASRVGLAWRCVDDERLLEVSIEMASRAAAAPRDLVERVKGTIGEVAAFERHEEALERELDDQVWSIEQPAFADRLAALQERIKSRH